MSECGQACGCATAATPSSDGAEASTATTTSHYAIPKMDCPSEERLIRMALDGTEGLGALQFDLERRELRVQHAGPADAITARLRTLGLGARLLSSAALAGAAAPPAPPDAQEARVLRWLLAINAVMFGVELASGWLAQSAGLIADALDMFADAAVYGLALYAVGRTARLKLRAAHLSGWLQLLLALGALAEVLHRLLLGSEPEPPLMMGIALLALAANVGCMALLARHRTGGVHMRASWIFSTNDVLANLGVIVAGALVAWSGSNVPDLVIGSVIALLVLNGARRILRLRA